MVFSSCFLIRMGSVMMLKLGESLIPCLGKIIVFWTSMIAADAQNAHGNHMLRVFVELSCSSFERPNPSMFASVLELM